jgi:alpha-L-rhamnosidase
MDRRELLLAVGGLSALSSCDNSRSSSSKAPAPQGPDSDPPQVRWAERAEALLPTLVETEQEPVALVRPRQELSHPLRYYMDVEAAADQLESYAFTRGESFFLDFGGHRTGFLSFRLETQGRQPDAPVRLRLAFGEVPTDVAEPFEPYTGRLSKGWLPEEIVTVDDLPAFVRLPRRYAFRYLKVEVIDTSAEFAVRFTNVRAHAVTSARTVVAAVGASELWRRIDEVSLATLRDCMQTCFEDGPRRDRRLWLGDLRLQALTNYATFKHNELAQRCLYLFAAHSRADGLVAACVYERPEPKYGGLHIVDYAALFNVVLLEYVQATGDLQTGRDLWPAAKRQLEILSADLDANGRYRNSEAMWIFIDWSDALDREASIQAVLIFAFKRTLDLARTLGTSEEVVGYAATIEQMSRAARAAFWDEGLGLAVSGPSRQVSWASQAWMALAGVLSRDEGARALAAALALPQAVKPVTPYLYHYVVEALLACGSVESARNLVASYWGSMAQLGADTFWESYDPAEPLSSPYGDIHASSYCHAWSCTPAYFVRTAGWSV